MKIRSRSFRYSYAYILLFLSYSIRDVEIYWGAIGVAVVFSLIVMVIVFAFLFTNKEFMSIDSDTLIVRLDGVSVEFSIAKIKNIELRKDINDMLIQLDEGVIQLKLKGFSRNKLELFIEKCNPLIMEKPGLK